MPEKPLIYDVVALNKAKEKHFQVTQYKPFRLSFVYPFGPGELWRVYKPLREKLKIEYGFDAYKKVIELFWELLLKKSISENKMFHVKHLGSIFPFKQKNDDFLIFFNNRDCRMVGGRLYGKKDINKSEGYYPGLVWRSTGPRKSFLQKHFFMRVGLTMRNYLYDEFFSGRTQLFTSFSTKLETYENQVNQQHKFHKLRLALQEHYITSPHNISNGL